MATKPVVSQELEKLKQQRASIKKNISRIKNLVEAIQKDEGKHLSATELKCRLGIAEACFKQILTYQTNIELLDPEDNAQADLEDIFIVRFRAT